MQRRCPYLESGGFASDCFAHDDLGVVVLEDPEETNEAWVISCLSRESQPEDIRTKLQALFPNVRDLHCLYPEGSHMLTPGDEGEEVGKLRPWVC
jgi:hypothetical protein